MYHQRDSITLAFKPVVATLARAGFMQLALVQPKPWVLHAVELVRRRAFVLPHPDLERKYQEN